MVLTPFRIGRLVGAGRGRMCWCSEWKHGAGDDSADLGDGSAPIWCEDCFLRQCRGICGCGAVLGCDVALGRRG